MKIQTILFLILISTYNLLFANCIENPFEKSELPTNLPDNVSIIYSENGGMTPTWHKIEIKKGQIVVEDKKMDKEKPNKWFAKITDEDLSALYQTFVLHKFDLIENDKQEGIVYDAESEGVRIRARQISKGVSYGMNSPLSGKHLTRYSAVAGEIKKLEDKYKSKAKTSETN